MLSYIIKGVYCDFVYSHMHMTCLCDFNQVFILCFVFYPYSIVAWSLL